ncbi:DUF2330 domain-containing protein [Sandaracinus amylolyticus]|uniref:DUF2330 domain-containing protein n=1 Tax=Sandaracinus amylolyticus TaxID=927083 RepID=UPI001F48DC9A|nr:DUF2330 domain-containing protein [Sandaracinus amylolyticus]UJR86064.1 Hypothetical protein I5071_81450 [Sandaracinus amylolyticus]
MSTNDRWWSAGALVLAASLLAPGRASACGGFFCQNVPMDQAGENILFSIEGDGTLTTHVQILYSGDADAFAWILPLPSIPELDVGSDELFRQLGQRTATRFDLTGRTEGTCRPPPERCGWDDTDEGPWPAPGAVADAGASAADAGGSVTVHFRGAVGPYDAVILQSGSADELFAWLDENDYRIPEMSRPLVADYVAARHVFVALKLLSSASTREIQPIVLRYREGQPCVPIRLTAIATIPDMPIIAYFLADRYATPNNYSRVEPTYDDLRLWRDFSYYPTYVSNLIDDAGGRGFVPEFAGRTPELFLELPSVSDLATITDPTELLQQLRSRGFAGDTQLLGILSRFLPPPAMYASDPSQYYNCLFFSWGSAESCGFAGELDAAGLVGAVEAQIVEPRREAQQMLARHARLTRLFTTMSADEMTIDPTFSLDSGLPDVSNAHVATLVTECSDQYLDWTAPQRVELPSGRSERWREGIAYAGSDEDLCDDMRSGDFAPWTPEDRLRATAERRALRPGGGGPRCAASASSRAGGASVLLAAGVVIAMAITRTRRRR